MTVRARRQVAVREPGLFVNRDFALLWTGQAVSNLGDVVFGTALILWLGVFVAREQSWGPAAVSGVLIAQYAPPLLVGPIAGVYVDRWDKRRTMLAMDALRTAIIGSLALLAADPPLPVFPQGRPPLALVLAAVYAGVALEATCAQFFNPARLALIGDIVEEPYRARASGLSQATVGLSVVLGPAIGAPLVLGAGVAWALLINALSFLISYATILAIRTPRSAVAAPPVVQRHFRRELGEGLAFVARTPALVALLVCLVLAMACLGTLSNLGIFFITRNLHADAAVFGPLGTLTGLGAISGGVALGLLAERIGVARLLWVATLALGVCMIAFARMTAVPPALVAAMLLGVVYAATQVAVGPLTLLLTPKGLVGRVSSVIMPAGSLAAVAAVILAGWLNSAILRGLHTSFFGVTLGPVDTFFTAVGLLTIVGAAWAAPRLEDVDAGAEPGAQDQPADLPAFG